MRSGWGLGCLGSGNMFQSNQAYSQFVVVTGGSESFFAERGWLFGILLAFVLGLVIVGGIKSIASVTSKLVPLMAILYCSCAVVVLADECGVYSRSHRLGVSGSVSTESRCRWGHRCDDDGFSAGSVFQ